MRVVCAPRLRALPPQGASQSSSPTRSLPPACGSQGGRGAEGGTREGARGRGANTRRTGRRRRGRRLHLPYGPFALAPAGSRPTARGGGPAQPGAPRAAAAAAVPASRAQAGGGSSRRASSRAREEREGWGVDPSRRRRRRNPGVPLAPGPRWERTLRTRSPAPARHSPPLNYLRRGPLRGCLLRVAPSRSPRREGEFLPVDVLFRNAKDQ